MDRWTDRQTNLSTANIALLHSTAWVKIADESSIHNYARKRVYKLLYREQITTKRVIESSYQIRQRMSTVCRRCVLLERSGSGTCLRPGVALE